MGIKTNGKRRTRAHSGPLAAPAETPRYVMLPGLETPSGRPVLALATGHPRRPMLRALASFASLAAPRAEGGAA